MPPEPMSAEPMSAEPMPDGPGDHAREPDRDHTEERLLRLAETLGTMEERLSALESRLAALDREWDMERSLQADAAALALVGLTLGTIVDRRFLALPMAAALFLLRDAYGGWQPPLAYGRRAGLRTRAEIEEERYALKAFRGDFDDLPEDPASGGGARMAAALAAVRR